jgi:hypothetical protein
MRLGEQTYSASSSGAARIVVLAAAVLAVRVSAVAVHVVALDGDGEIKLRISGRSVLEDCEPSSAVRVANTEVERSVVAPGVGRRAPPAGLT